MRRGNSRGGQQGQPTSSDVSSLTQSPHTTTTPFNIEAETLGPMEDSPLNRSSNDPMNRTKSNSQGGRQTGGNFSITKTPLGPQRPQRSGSSKESTPSSRSSTGITAPPRLNSQTGMNEPQPPQQQRGAPYQHPMPYRQDSRGGPQLRSPHQSFNQGDKPGGPGGMHPRTSSFGSEVGPGGGRGGRSTMEGPSWRRAQGGGGMNQMNGRGYHSGSGAGDEMVKPMGAGGFRGGGRGLRNVGTLPNPNQSNQRGPGGTQQSGYNSNESLGGYHNQGGQGRRGGMMGNHNHNNRNLDMYPLQSSRDFTSNGIMHPPVTNQQVNNSIGGLRGGQFHHDHSRNDTRHQFNRNNNVWGPGGTTNERFNHGHILDWLKERTTIILTEYKTQQSQKRTESYSTNGALSTGKSPVTTSSIRMYELTHQPTVHSPKEDFLMLMQQALLQHAQPAPYPIVAGGDQMAYHPGAIFHPYPVANAASIPPEGTSSAPNNIGVAAPPGFSFIPTAGGPFYFNPQPGPEMFAYPNGTTAPPFMTGYPPPALGFVTAAPFVQQPTDVPSTERVDTGIPQVQPEAQKPQGKDSPTSPIKVNSIESSTQ